MSCAGAIASALTGLVLALAAGVTGTVRGSQRTNRRLAELEHQVRQGGAAGLQVRVRRQRRQLGAGADGELHRPAARLLDLVEVLDLRQADDLARPGDVVLLPRHQVGAAGQQLGRAPLGVEQADRRFGRGWSVVGEIVHARGPEWSCLAWP